MESDPKSLGLVGDGDEIAAIDEVEREFGVKLDYSDAENWSTVGDVYDALLRELSTEEAHQPGTWARFARAISQLIGIPESSVRRETGLIAEDGIWVHVIQISTAVWAVIGIGVIGFLIWALLS